MLPVTLMSAVDSNDGTLPFMMSSTGSFKPDANGVLRTESGLALLGWPANIDGTIPARPRDSSAGLEPVVFNSNAFAAEATTIIRFGANLPAVDTRFDATGDPLEVNIEYFGNLGTSETLTATFTPTIPATGQSNTWNLQIFDSATGAAAVAEFEIEFDGSRSNAGSILNVTDIAGGTYDLTTGELSINVAGGPITVDIGTPGSSSQLTQLSADFAPIAITKNGAPVGNVAGVEIDANGFLKSVYDTGFTRTIYQIPLADVANPDGLTPLDNQAYAVSSGSGPVYFWNAGDGPTGNVIGFAREESTADIAGELTQLIQTQRAYASNAKVIQTVDEMLQETTNIKR
jgi:flagellar hook protein FlgE